MSNHLGLEEPLSRLANHHTIGATLGTVLALVAIAAALLIAAAYPMVGGPVVAVGTGVVIGALALAVPIATAVLSRLRLPSHNDAWVFW